ncbi:ankyrin repeat domain-containing protein [Wolbachia endosymbiont of Ctenocephalides felis wCfeJ]|uniref:ankyrin repeat domain-containing protein n=1 Tax=Wolbachia endosymbiont of Ctenocephalides felis wCfeJ TaxID=2732594 RepID=UPI001446E5DF|nr:ankyrin repeat domain-containing protein [Wolbachia endosymbiont of Ctenocephalides felis wCfeJ]WCR58321.1 MAG: Phosphocholine transferase AnkX [Wolbachia endosymbiont of Ctenocephalides felis wCfeJ]
MLDHYDILGVKLDATLSEITKSYKALSLKYHPDRLPPEKIVRYNYLSQKRKNDDLSEVEEEELDNLDGTFKRLQAAYDTLSDQNKRDNYTEDLKLQLYTKLVQFIECNSLEKIRSLIEKCGSVAHRVINIHKNEINWTALHYAIEAGNPEVVKFLTEKGANIDAKDNHGKTPSNIAKEKGLTEIVDILASTERKSPTYTSLHDAAREGDLGAIKYLVSKGANINDKDRSGWVPLHRASQEGELEAVQYLVDKGANLNIADIHNRMTPLHLAAYNGRLEVVQYLVDKGADLNAATISIGHTLFFTASKSRAATITYFSRTPLHLAAAKGRLEIVQYLIEDKKVDLNVADWLNRTILHLASQYGKLEVVQYLVDKGADLNVVDKDGRAPLHLAAMIDLFDKDDRLKTVRYLVDNGASLNAADKDGMMPLHWAALEGRLEIVKYLVDNVADLDAANKDGMTPLHLAALKGRLEIVKYLVNNGANFKKTTKDGTTSLDLAGNRQVVNFLKECYIKRAQRKKCNIQCYEKQQKTFLYLSKFVSSYIPNSEVKSLEQGLYLPSFAARNVKFEGKCIAITRGLSQALLSRSGESFVSNLKASAEIYERIAQGKQVSKREEREAFAFSKLLSSFERQQDSTTNSLPSSLIRTQDHKMLSELSDYIAGIKGDFAIHLVTSNHVVAIYRKGDNYAYFDSNAAFVSGLKSIDQLMQVVEKGIKSAGYEMGEKGLLVEHFDVARANSLLSDKDKQILAKEIKTERQLLAEQDKELGLIKFNGQEISRVQLYDFGTKINIGGGVPLLINADMNLSSKKFQEHLDRKEISMTARDYLDSLKKGQNMKEVVQATKVIPFIGSRREIEEAEQTRKLKQSLSELAKGAINHVLATVALTSVIRSEAKTGGPESHFSSVTVDKQLKRSPGH